MGTVHQTFTGDAKGVLKELEKMQRANTALEEKLNRVAMASAKASRESRTQASSLTQYSQRAASGLQQWAMGYVSLQSAIQLVNNALAEQKRLSEEAIKTQSNVAGGQAEVLKNLGDVSDIQGKQFLARLDQLRAETGMSSVVPVQMAAGSILSATGGNQEQTIEILKAAAPLFKTKPDELAQFGGALADVQKALSADGKPVSAQSTAALMLAIQGQARFTDLGGFKNVAPALATVDVVSGRGKDETEAEKMRDVREGAALFAGIGSRLGDATGDRTKTAVANLAANLARAVPELDTTFARLEQVRKSPELQEEVLKSGFEGAQKPAIAELISGDGGTTGRLVDSAFKQIQGSDAALKRKTKQLESLTPELAIRDLRERAAGNVEDIERQEYRGREALAREILFGKDGKPGSLAQTRSMVQGVLSMGDTMPSLMFESAMAEGREPEQAAINILRTQRGVVTSDIFGGQKSKLTASEQAKVDLIDKQTQVLQQSLERVGRKIENSGRQVKQAVGAKTIGKNDENR